ncbi:MAG TPA: protein kinase, partial [Myxococcota bacterium]|nr:protein kinase [Myxococcota bacterium]
MLKWLFGRRAALPPPPPDPAPLQPPPQPGDVLGERYELVRLLGEGGAGRVFQARDTALGLQVAVKIIATEGPRSAGLSLKEEALAAMRLSHRFIARTYHWERFGTYEAIVMELVTGGTLADWIGCAHNQRRRIEQGAGFVIDALDGLAYAHDLDVLHNDIKPQNLLVGVGEQIKLCDFGISVALGDSSRRGHGAAGTVTYLSPERIRSGGSSPASDIYAIGAVLYELITGAPPFGVGFAAIDGHLDQPVPAMPGVPRELELVVHAALAKDPLDRPSTAHDMRDALIQAGFTSRWQVINGDERTGPSRPPFFRAAPQARPADSSTGDTLTPDPQSAPSVAPGSADADEVDDDPTDQGADARRALSLTDPADPPTPRQARRDAPESASMAPNQPWPTPRTPSAPPRSPRNEPDPSAPNHATSSPAAPARVDAPAPPRTAP